MKKLAIAIFAVVCVAMFIAPAYADDRVSLYGSMRVRGWDKTTHAGADSSYIDQRFRIGTKINVADDVYVEMRADYGEGTWGLGYNPGLISRPGLAIDLDRGFLNIDKEMWSLRVGQQFLALGIMEVLDANATAAKLVLKLPVKTSLIYAKVSENGLLNDDGDNDDTDVYAINFSYDSDAFSSNLFAITKNDGSAIDDSPTMFGFHMTAPLGMLNLAGELSFGTGDTADGATDYMGTQFYLQADANVSDAFSLGAELLYALAADDDEIQLTGMSDWGDFTPMSLNTPFGADFTAFDGWTSPFDPTGDSAGVQGITFYGKYNVMEGLALGGKFGYFTPEDDDKTVTDDITSFNVWASYMLATNTELAVAYLYSEYDNLDDEQETLVARLQVSF